MGTQRAGARRSCQRGQPVAGVTKDRIRCPRDSAGRAHARGRAQRARRAADRAALRAGGRPLRGGLADHRGADHLPGRVHVRAHLAVDRQRRRRELARTAGEPALPALRAGDRAELDRQLGTRGLPGGALAQRGHGRHDRGPDVAARAPAAGPAHGARAGRPQCRGHLDGHDGLPALREPGAAARRRLAGGDGRGAAPAREPLVDLGARARRPGRLRAPPAGGARARLPARAPARCGSRRSRPDPLPSVRPPLGPRGHVRDLADRAGRRPVLLERAGDLLRCAPLLPRSRRRAGLERPARARAGRRHRLSSGRRRHRDGAAGRELVRRGERAAARRAHPGDRGARAPVGLVRGRLPPEVGHRALRRVRGPAWGSSR